MGWPAFDRRSYKPEIMDDPDVPARFIHRSLDFIVGVNRFLGGTRVVLDFFDRHRTPDAFSVLDLGTGSGDIPYALVRWGEARGKRVSVTALDLNPACLEYARRRFPSDRIRYTRASAFDLDRLEPHDYVTSSMFFHHLKDAEILRLLKLMHTHARRGFILNDLYRTAPAYYGVALLSVLSFNKIVFNDGKLSVQRAFREEDFETYRRDLGLPEAKIRRHPMYRISLSHIKR